MSQIWTVETVIAAARNGKLAVPVFQRGAVWDRENKQRLVESLVRGVPIGAFTVWSPANRSGREGAVDFLCESEQLVDSDALIVIDGQQRIRALLEIFTIGAAVTEQDRLDVEAEAPPSPGESKGCGPTVWCVRLSSDGKEIRIAQRELNKKLQDSAQRTWIPIPLLTDETAGYDVPDPGPDAMSIRHNQDSARAEFHNNVKDQHFAKLQQVFSDAISTDLTVVALVERVTARDFQPKYDAAEIISLYTRLNSVGMAMTKTERDLARLAKVTGARVQSALRSVFAEVPHGSASGDPLSRDALLRRAAERLFGVDLFVRVAHIVAAFMTNAAGPGGEWTETSLAEIHAKGRSVELVDTAAALLVAAARVIKQEECNDFQRLAEISRLEPMFALMVRFPDSARADSFLGLLVRKLLFEPGDNHTESRIRTAWSNRYGTPAEVVQAWFADGTAQKQSEEPIFASSLDRASSKRSRWVDLLFWLERRGGKDIVDLPYTPENVGAPSRLLDKRGSEPRINHGWAKGHLLPRSFPRDKEGRSIPDGRSHEVNGIWNLTYMSHEFNGLDGLNNKMPVLAGAKDENLSGRCLADEAHRDYHELWTVWKESLVGSPLACDLDNAKHPVSAKFLAFKTSRLKLLYSAFSNLYPSIVDVVQAARSVDSRMANRLDPSVFDNLCAAGLHRSVACELSEYVARVFRPKSGCWRNVDRPDWSGVVVGLRVHYRCETPGCSREAPWRRTIRIVAGGRTMHVEDSEGCPHRVADLGAGARREIELSAGPTDWASWRAEFLLSADPDVLVPQVSAPPHPT